MRRLINKVLQRFGFALYSKRNFRNNTHAELKQAHNLDDIDVASIKGKFGMGLREHLFSENKTKWLDVGCGGNFEEHFFYVDVFPEGMISEKDRYFRTNIINATESELERMGKFDLIRMQHVFEHFTPEDGKKVLFNCAQLLNPGGYILISTPDLKKYIAFYQNGTIRDGFDWALQRVEKDSPDSFFFSVFSHSVSYESHEWCYDAEGLKYQLASTGKFGNIEELTLDHPMANVPFTHNRPHEDVCVLAQLI